MKNHYSRIGNNIALTLLGVCTFLLVVVMVQILESEALVHGQVASDWYVRTLDAISLRNFT